MHAGKITEVSPLPSRWIQNGQKTASTATPEIGEPPRVTTNVISPGNRFLYLDRSVELTRFTGGFALAYLIGWLVARLPSKDI